MQRNAAATAGVAVQPLRLDERTALVDFALDPSTPVVEEKKGNIVDEAYSQERKKQKVVWTAKHVTTLQRQKSASDCFASKAHVFEASCESGSRDTRGPLDAPVQQGYVGRFNHQRLRNRHEADLESIVL
ncbi:hypothetical protein DVH05_012339 [Phytophthora capsici]|nr:hypothetical protein DVH05_012339 [Phytophthora capsici]